MLTAVVAHEEAVSLWALFGMYREGARPSHPSKQHQQQGVVSSLNYSPGPMDTDMQASLRSSSTVDKEIQAAMTAKFTKGELVDVDASAAQCAKLIQSRKFVAGAHVDYYDCVGGDA